MIGDLGTPLERHQKHRSTGRWCGQQAVPPGCRRSLPICLFAGCVRVCVCLSSLIRGRRQDSGETERVSRAVAHVFGSEQSGSQGRCVVAFAPQRHTQQRRGLLTLSSFFLLQFFVFFGGSLATFSRARTGRCTLRATDHVAFGLASQSCCPLAIVRTPLFSPFPGTPDRESCASAVGVVVGCGVEEFATF